MTVSAAICIFFLIQILPAPRISRANPWRRDPGDPMIIVHGGAKELYPENTALAFREISKLEIDAIEVDLALTKDNILITHHDLSIDRMTSGSGLVRELTYSRIRQFDYAEDFPGIEKDYPYRGHPLAYPETLENLFIKYPDYFYVIEIKDKEKAGHMAADLLISLISKYAMEDKVLIASFDDEIINYFSHISKGELLLSTARKEATRYVLFEKLRMGLFYKPRTHVLETPLMEKIGNLQIDLSTVHFIKEAHRHNMAVHYWTVNDRDEMERLISRGVDGIITDRPDIMIELLKSLH